jgi:hypothetical protein
MGERLSPELIATGAGVDLVHLVAARVRLTRKGSVFWGLCPFHREKTPSFTVSAAPWNTYHCFACSAHGGPIDWLMQMDNMTFPEAVRTLTGAPILSRHNAVETRADPITKTDKADDTKARIAKARWLWARRASIIGTPAETYLRGCRGYAGPIPATLGYLAPTKPEHPPAMIAAFGLANEPEPGVLAIHNVEAVHLTLLAPDGCGKADSQPNKIMIGPVKGNPICLAPPTDMLALAITEGIEDALSVHAATGLGAWAAGSASLMPALADALPSYLDCITIYADSDDSGLRNAAALHKRLQARLPDTEIVTKQLSGGGHENGRQFHPMRTWR